ncbi:MAG: ABC transporter permease, partial [Oscillospiraceae bacterium]|nr:ABC transporter permease [Oscillospiraceae bacterium]
MLGKLIKYDLMADWKKYSALYAATLLVSVMLLIMSKIKERISDNRILELVEDMFGIVLMTLIVAIGIAVSVLTVMRFYKNVVRDEGYLTHTLPVHTWEILASKLIS